MHAFVSGAAGNPIYRAANAVIRTLLRRLPVTDRTERAALAWGYRYRPEAAEIRLRSGLWFRYSKPDFIPLSLYYLGTFEAHALSYALRAVQPGGAVLDVGANIGFYTVELANRVGREGRVLAIEAIPHHAESVRRNLGLNGLENTEVVQIAVGAQPGTVRLGIPSNGNEGTYSVGGGAGEETFEAAVRTIDDIVAEKELNSLDLIKMDIEGSEFVALSGAGETLRQFRPTILIELNEEALNRCASSSAQVKDLLGGLGYKGWILTRRGVRRIDPSDRHHCDECLFIHESRMPLAIKLGLEAAA